MEREGNQLTEQIERPGLPSAQSLRNEQRREFRDLAEYAETQKNLVLDDGGILRYPGRDKLPIVVPSSTRSEFLR